MCKVIAKNGCCKCVTTVAGVTLKGVAKFYQGAVTGYSISDIGVALFEADPSMNWLIPVVATGGTQVLLHYLQESGRTSKKIQDTYFMVLSQIIKFSALGSIFYRNYQSNTQQVPDELRDNIILALQGGTAALALLSFSLSVYKIAKLKQNKQRIAPLAADAASLLDSSSDEDGDSLNDADFDYDSEDNLEAGQPRCPARCAAATASGCATGASAVTNFFRRRVGGPVKYGYDKTIGRFVTDDNLYAAHSTVDNMLIGPITKALPFTAAAGFLSNIFIDKAAGKRVFPLGYSSLFTWGLFPLFILKNIVEQASSKSSSMLDKGLHYPINTLGNMIMPLYMNIFLYVMTVHYSTDRPVNEIGLDPYFLAAAVSFVAIVGLARSCMVEEIGEKRLPKLRSADLEMQAPESEEAGLLAGQRGPAEGYSTMSVQADGSGLFAFSPDGSHYDTASSSSESDGGASTNFESVDIADQSAHASDETEAPSNVL